MTQHNDRPSGCQIEIVAHRGASFEAPENTLAAVELAWQLNADAVEIDVQLTRDGKLAVIHDPTLSRTAGIDRSVRDVDMSELRTIDVGSWKDDKWEGETVPELPQILATIPAGRRLFIELKFERFSETQHKIAESLERDFTNSKVDPDSVVLISFFPGVLALAKKRLTELSAYLIAEQNPVLLNDAADRESDLEWQPSVKWQPSIETIISICRTAGFDGIDLSNTEAVTCEAILEARKLRLHSCVWTVNSVIEAQRLIAAGVNSLTTDDPRTIIDALRSHDSI